MKKSFNHDLSTSNTFRMNVSCACYIEYDSVEELADFFSSGRQFDLPRPFLHIGGGSNLLFTKDFPGTVFHSGIRFVSPLEGGGQADAYGAGEVMVEVGAGIRWDDFCGWCAERGLWGPENLSGIPGETGAAAVQNIGAYGTEFKDVVRKIRSAETNAVTGTGTPSSSRRPKAVISSLQLFSPFLPVPARSSDTAM